MSWSRARSAPADRRRRWRPIRRWPASISAPGRLMLQLVADGLMLGATVSLGAIGLTLTYSILRFANFTHGEFVTIGAYVALAALAGFGGFVADAGKFGDLSFGW